MKSISTTLQVLNAVRLWLMICFFFMFSDLLLCQRLTFAVLSDTHIGSFAYADDDLKQSIDDINKNDSIDFVLLSGDITEFGTDNELQKAHHLLSGLRKKYFVVPGNHDTNWSESGGISFDKVFGKSHFLFDAGGLRFMGCASGPLMRMGPCCVPAEDMAWLKKSLQSTPSYVPVVFLIHAPLEKEMLSNWDEIIDLLKTRNIQFVICGHLHVNKKMDFEGIQGVAVRSNLRRKDPCGGYTIVHIDKSKASFYERRVLDTMKPVAWASFVMKQYRAETDTARPVRRDFRSQNAAYPFVKESWKIQDDGNIVGGLAVQGRIACYTTTNGEVKAINVSNGKLRWTYRTNNKIVSEPCIRDNKLVVTSTDGSVTCLSLSKGGLLWRYETGVPFVATPLIVKDMVYVGGTRGSVYAISMKDGMKKWEFTGVKGFIEARPVVLDSMIYVGSWGAEFYALNRFTGKLIWKFAPGKSRYFSPAACWPVTYGDRVFVQSADGLLYNFEGRTGRLLWATPEPKGRESLGISPDAMKIFVKSVLNKVTAIDASRYNYTPLWIADLKYGADYGPTRISCADNRVYVATASGTIYCLSSLNGAEQWQHKLSNGLITSVVPLGKHALLAATMEGSVVRLTY